MSFFISFLGWWQAGRVGLRQANPPLTTSGRNGADRWRPASRRWPIRR
jgi:hypothetical protein